MIGPLATAPGDFTHVLVAIDKFTKRIEYKPITKLCADRVVSFPNTIITDLGSNFHSHKLWEFCEVSAIEVKYVSVAHPRANCQVERTNGMILDGLKKRFYDENNRKGGKWIHEISSSLDEIPDKALRIKDGSRIFHYFSARVADSLGGAFASVVGF
ncbi:uncharacterized protein LOC112890510 [Panicum hallii]|uniref:uncharacterized protein LOC112890510 n=1 Tax=Panicum hallii TaxID=206008 RepID=UPI000DF4DA1D|nr:uncharacterized protein LOC112890510 [Panicum hallii]